MTTDAGHERTDERTRPRRALHRLIPAAKPRQVEEAAYSISRKSVEQGKPEERNVPRSSQEKLGEAVRGRETLGAWAGRLRHYGLALLLVAVGVMVRMALTRLVGPGLPPYITFYPLVMLAALIGGWGPGLLATLATAALVNYWLLPARTFQIGGMADAVGLAFFCVMGIFVSIVAEFYRRTRDHLDELVVVRTAALSQANEQLHQEVAERSHAEEALRLNEERLALAMRGAGAGAWETDLDTGENVWGQGMSELLGVPPEHAEVESRQWTKYIHPEDQDRVVAAVRAASQEGKAWSAEFRVIRADGSIQWFSSRGTIMTSSDGRRKMVGVDQNITERKQAEELVRASEQRFRALTERSADVVAIFDPEGKIAYISPSIRALFGFAPEEIVGQSLFAFIHPDDAERTQALIAEAFCDPTRTLTSELRTRHQNGQWRWIAVAGRNLMADPTVGGLVANFQDITGRKQAEEVLKVKDNAIASSLNAIAMADLQGRLTYINPAFLKLWGYEDEQEVLGKSVLDFWAEPQRALETVQAIRDGRGWTGELVAVRKDGTHLNLYLSASTVLSDEGTPICMMASLVDVTERKRAEEALRQAKTFTDKLLNAPLDTVFLFEPATGKPVRWNKRFAEVSGYSDEEIAGMKAPDDFYDEDDLQKAQEGTRRTLADGQGVVVLSLITKQGVPIPFEYAGTVVQDEEGKTLLLSVGRDITERKQAEEALRESEQRYRKLFEANLAGVYLSKLDGTILDCNEAMLRMVGYSSRQEVLGRRASDFYVDPESRQELVRLLQRDGVVPARETVLRRKDGSILHAFGSAVLLVNEQTGEPYVQGVAIDITQRKEAEESLRELTRTLETKVAQRTAELEHRAQQLQKLTLDMSEAEDRERKRMAEILHDDLQQIIAGAKFHLNLLRHRVRYDASVQALGAQIDQMLKDAIEKSRGLSHELSPAVLHHRDFTETLGWLAGQMRNKHGLVVHVHAPGKVDLQSDAITALLYRTAQELLFNVVKHARVNEARLRVRRHGRYVCLSVSDRGRGFDPQVLREATGYGLLSIRERIELLGGRMRIKSAAGKGSAAFIVVPDSGVHEATAEAGTRSNGPAAVGERATHEERGRIRVLLADDHQIVREGLRLLLREEYDIEIVGEAAHGREAVDLALRLEPDVVIMDVSMPLIDGDAATQQIKEYLPQTRVIALSTYNEPEKMERMYRAGAEGYVLKTASSEELLAALRGKEPHWQKKPV